MKNKCRHFGYGQIRWDGRVQHHCSSFGEQRAGMFAGSRCCLSEESGHYQAMACNGRDTQRTVHVKEPGSQNERSLGKIKQVSQHTANDNL